MEYIANYGGDAARYSRELRMKGYTNTDILQGLKIAGYGVVHRATLSSWICANRGYETCCPDGWNEWHKEWVKQGKPGARGRTIDSDKVEKARQVFMDTGDLLVAMDELSEMRIKLLHMEEGQLIWRKSLGYQIFFGKELKKHGGVPTGYQKWLDRNFRDRHELRDLRKALKTFSEIFADIGDDNTATFIENMANETRYSLTNAEAYRILNRLGFSILMKDLELYQVEYIVDEALNREDDKREDSMKAGFITGTPKDFKSKYNKKYEYQGTNDPDMRYISTKEDIKAQIRNIILIRKHARNTLPLKYEWDSVGAKKTRLGTRIYRKVMLPNGMDVRVMWTVHDKMNIAELLGLDWSDAKVRIQIQKLFKSVYAELLTDYK